MVTRCREDSFGHATLIIDASGNNATWNWHRADDNGLSITDSVMFVRDIVACPNRGTPASGSKEYSERVTAMRPGCVRSEWLLVSQQVGSCAMPGKPQLMCVRHSRVRSFCQHQLGSWCIRICTGQQLVFKGYRRTWPEQDACSQVTYYAVSGQPTYALSVALSRKKLDVRLLGAVCRWARLEQ